MIDTEQRVVIDGLQPSKGSSGILALALSPTMRVAPRGLTETDQERSIVSGPVIMGGAFRSFAAARSRRSWLATWPVMSA